MYNMHFRVGIHVCRVVIIIFVSSNLSLWKYLYWKNVLIFFFCRE